MPEVDGFQVSKHLRARERENGGCSHLPVIALTAMATKRDRERCLEAGMDDYVSKPIQTQELFAVLAHLAAGGERPVVDRRRAVPRPPLASNGSGDFDPSAALKHVGGDPRLLAKLVRLYLADSARWLMELRQAVDRRDAVAVHRTGHNLKGALVHFELGGAITLAETLEFLGKNANLDGAGEALTALEAELERLQPQLTEYIRRDEG
jgi:two-component system, sensor histidine kinase and response regulator